MTRGTVVAIHTAPKGGAPMEPKQRVKAVAGKGLEGDRYFAGEGTFSQQKKAARQLTLIEIEAYDALAALGLPLPAGASRRNITTKGVRLNPLVDREFTIGSVRVRGVKLCHPCGHLETLTKPGVEKGLTERGGLNVEILGDGEIRVGDEIVVAAARSCRELAEAQLAAYNARDLDAFCACYAEDVRVLDADGAVTFEGMKVFRERYGKLFAECLDLHGEATRVVAEPHAVDEETWRRKLRDGREESGRLLVRYTARDGRIAVVQFFKEGS